MSQRLLCSLFLTLLLTAFSGCHKPPAPPPGPPTIPELTALFHQVELNSHLRAVQSTLRSHGEQVKHDDLTISPKPMELYPKLPLDTQYWLWRTADNSVTLLLGVGLDERVIYREIIAERSGGVDSEAVIDEHFQ